MFARERNVLAAHHWRKYAFENTDRQARWLQSQQSQSRQQTCCLQSLTNCSLHESAALRDLWGFCHDSWWSPGVFCQIDILPHKGGGGHNTEIGDDSGYCGINAGEWDGSSSARVLKLKTFAFFFFEDPHQTLLLFCQHVFFQEQDWTQCAEYPVAKRKKKSK